MGAREKSRSAHRVCTIKQKSGDLFTKALPTTTFHNTFIVLECDVCVTYERKVMSDYFQENLMLHYSFSFVIVPIRFLTRKYVIQK